MTKGSRVQPVIMCGGAGTRLWPLSRSNRPKQFLPLVSNRSLFQDTALRLSGNNEVEFLPPVVIAGADHLDHIRQQLEEIGVAPSAIIIEPMARNTAAVAAVAGAWTAAHQPGALTLLAPADHHIDNPASFRAAVAKGARAAEKGAIVTFGVRPTEPHTGYGYIEAGAEFGDSVAEVAAFREKPDLETALRYVEGGRHFWNAGIFLFAPNSMANEIAVFAPEIGLQATSALANAIDADGVCRLDASQFANCPADTIDYAIMEKTSRAAVVGPVDAGWSDIGAWTAMPNEETDDRIAAIDCNGVVIRTDGPFVGAIGVSDLVIVATADAVLVAPKSQAQNVKKIIEELKKRGREDLL